MPIKKGGIQQRQKFTHKVIAWFGGCSKGVTPLVILEEGIVVHIIYVEKMLPIAWKY